MDPISNPSTDARSLHSLIASATAVAPRSGEALVTDRYKLEDRPLERRGFRFGDTFTRDRREEVDAFTRLMERLRHAAGQRDAAEPIQEPPSPAVLAPRAGADLASPVAPATPASTTTPAPQSPVPSTPPPTEAAAPDAQQPAPTTEAAPSGSTTEAAPSGSTSGTTTEASADAKDKKKQEGLLGLLG